MHLPGWFAILLKKKKLANVDFVWVVMNPGLIKLEWETKKKQADTILRVRSVATAGKVYIPPTRLR